MKFLRILFVFFAIAISRGAALTPETIQMIASKYIAKQPLPTLETGFTMDEALRAQDLFVRTLQRDLGDVAGYKIGVITKQGQERLHTTGPVHGVLLKQMLQTDHTKISAHYGIRPGLELDMGVVVKDAQINDAKTLDEVLPHLFFLDCFIELVDSITATNQPMDAALLTALNVGARAGVWGGRIKLKPEIAKAIPDMRMWLTDEDGKVVYDIPKLNLQPLDNIPWLIAELKKSGKRLKQGDFISVGSPAPIQPVIAGKTMTLHYDIPGARAMHTTVTFTE